MFSSFRLRAGLLGCAIAVATLFGCGGDDSASGEKDWKSTVDAKRAFADLQAYAAIGGVSHAPNASEKMKAGRDLIVSRLKAAGLAVKRDPWGQPVPTDKTGTAPPRVVLMENIVGTIPGKRPEAIAIGCHYDTKILPGKSFVGANDGGSGVAVTLELARQLARKYADPSAERPPFTLKFVFFDGEEAFQDWNLKFKAKDPETQKEKTIPDNCYGSRRIAARPDEFHIETLILLDMVGDKDLQLSYETGSSRELRRIFVDTSKDVFGIDVFGPDRQILDDHISFKEKGMIRVIDLIDFEYGPGNIYWHQPTDTPDKCSPDSLARVGTLVLAALPAVEKWLQAQIGD